MKKNSMNNYFSRAFCLLLILTPATTGLWGQNDKTIEKEFANIRDINIEHRGGPIVVKPSTDGKTYVRATISVEAAPEDARKVYDQFDLRTSEQAGKLDLKTVFGVVNSISLGGSIRLLFDDGTKVRNIHKLSLNFEVRTPDPENLWITNRYHDIRIEDGVQVKKTLTIQTYEGNLQIGDIQGALNLDAKYTKGTVGAFGAGKLTLYECKLQFGDGGRTELNTKYSKLVFGRLAGLTMMSYEDEVQTGDIQGDVQAADKYSRLQFGSFHNGSMDTYETKFSSPSVRDLQLKSKYTEWKIGRADQIYFELSYEDKAELENIAALTTANSKYGEFNIGTLRKKLSLQSYEDDVVVRQVENSFEEITLDGKYINLEANLPDNLGYQIEAVMKYGKLEYPGGEQAFDWLVYKEKGDNLEVKGKRKGASDSSPRITINTYEGKIRLQ